MRVRDILMATALIFGAASITACDEKTKKTDEPAAAQTPDKVADALKTDTSKKDAEPSKTADGKPLPFEATGPVATVDGEEITAERFNAEVDKLMRLTGGNLPPQMAQFYKKQMLQRVVDEYLLDAEVAKKKITINDEQLQKEYDKFVARFPSKEQFEMYFKRSGMSEEELRKDLRKRMSHEQLLADISVSDADIKEFYDKNIERFQEEEQVKARHILFKLPKDADAKSVKAAEKKAAEISKLASKKGADFGELAKEHSEGPSGPRGGDLGMFPRKRMVKAFSDAAFELKAGQISKPVRTEFGIHIIKVEEKTESKTKSMDEVKEMIEYNLSSNKVREGMNTLLSELKKTRKTELKEDNIRMNVKAPATPPMIPGMGAPGGAAGHGGHGHDHGAGSDHAHGKPAPGKPAPGGKAPAIKAPALKIAPPATK